MGNVWSSAEARSYDIDDALDEHREAEKHVVKLLLLGAAESGKSTVLKQMRLMDKKEFSTEERLFFSPLVYTNTLVAMRTILRALPGLGLKLGKNISGEPFLLEDSLRHDAGDRFNPALVRALKTLWADRAVQKALMRTGEFYLPDNAVYYLSNLDRISHCHYIPSEADILRTRVPTSGIVEVNFQFKGARFRVVDVGGQRSQRKKWIHAFEDVNAIIFLVALSEYDQVLIEDGTTNRIKESLMLFSFICKCGWFEETSIILFLNKKDLFEEKIKRVALGKCFPKFNGPQTYNGCVNFIEQEFAKLARDQKTYHKKSMYVFQTCATDTNQVQMILNSAIDTIIQQNLKSVGMY